MKVSIKGGPEIEAALRELGKQVTARAIGRLALDEAAKHILADAKALAPDDTATGANKYLREAIKVGAAKRVRFNRGQSRGSIDRADQIWRVIGIDQNVDPPKDVTRKSGGGTYRDPGVAGVAPIQEFGAPAINMPAQPFLRPAWEKNKAATPQRIADGVQAEFEKAAARAARKKVKVG